jgi:hypothetical protein
VVCAGSVDDADNDRSGGRGGGKGLKEVGMKEVGMKEVGMKEVGMKEVGMKPLAGGTRCQQLGVMGRLRFRKATRRCGRSCDNSSRSIP